MYQLKNNWLEQMNIALEAIYKPSMDLCMHWPNPLHDKCEKRLYPDKI